LKVLGALDAGRFVDEDAQGFASAVKAVGEQAGVRLMHWVVNVVKLDSLGHGENTLFGLLKPCQSIAGGRPPATWQGPELKIIQNRIQKRFARSSSFIGSENYRTNVALPIHFKVTNDRFSPHCGLTKKGESISPPR
jgi:hypothetical protein